MKIICLMSVLLFGVNGSFDSESKSTTEPPPPFMKVWKRQVVNGGPACPPLVIPNGNANYLQASLTQQYASGTTATITCNLGFTPSGASTITCQNGAWLPIAGSCIASNPLAPPPLGLPGLPVAPGLPGAPLIPGTLSCGDVLPPLNGAVTYSGESTPGLHPSGSSVTLTCNAGHILQGTASSICSNAIWNPPLGLCL